jgi:hypothetical protein
MKTRNVDQGSLELGEQKRIFFLTTAVDVLFLFKRKCANKKVQGFHKIPPRVLE